MSPRRRPHSVPTAAQHPLGAAWTKTEGTCGSCAWSTLRGPGPKVLRCVAADYRPVLAEWRGCASHEAELDCLDCAACCGPAFDAVEVSQRDPVRKRLPQLLVRISGRLQVPRTTENHCAALDRSDNRCRIYADRPACCRDFTLGSANCIWARRRVGRSPPWTPVPKER